MLVLGRVSDFEGMTFQKIPSFEKNDELGVVDSLTNRFGVNISTRWDLPVSITRVYFKKKTEKMSKKQLADVSWLAPILTQSLPPWQPRGNKDHKHREW